LLSGGTYGYTRLEAGGQRKFHGGVDLYAEPETTCYALYKGHVEWVNDFGKKGWGKAVLTRVDFPKKTFWALYAHLSKVLVKKNTKLGPRTVVGLTGITGNGDSRYPHLHFETWKSLSAGKSGTKEKYRTDPLEVLGSLPYSPYMENAIQRAKARERIA